MLKFRFILMIIIVSGALFLSACGNRVDDTIDYGNSATDNLVGEPRDGNDESSENEDLLDDGEQIDNEGLNNHGISFVQQDSFYNDTVYIEIESDKPCDIYFTLDGSDPDGSKEFYQGKIELKSSSETKAYSVKAKGYYEDGSETDTIVHTYFIGKNVESRFDTLVFSITTDPYNLYDYEYGIFIEGKLRDDFIRNNPRKWIDPPDPANYNMRGRDSERDIFIEVFEPDGTKVISQAAGLRVYGGWSRAHLQKSVRLFARKAYDEVNNKFRYEFFPNKRAASGDGTIIRNFKRLVLRNSGNDNAHGFIRDELFQTLAGQAGFMDYQAVRPAAVFINGDYHGYLWLHEVYEDEYFEEHYGDYEGHFEVLEGGETFKNAEEDGSNRYAISDYEEAYSFTYEDLTDDTVYNMLREVIDVENYLDYYAYQIYLLNEDWPHNNYRTYRYYAAEGEEYGEAPFDGKWRYMLHDIDFTFGIYGTGPWTDNLQKYVNKSGSVNREAPLFSQLLNREDCKEYFIKRTLDFANGALSPDNLNKVLDKMNAARMNEQLRMYGKNLMADWAQPDQIPGRMEDIKEWGANRVTSVMGKHRLFFGLGEIYELNVKPAVGTGVRINNVEAFSDFIGRYYPDYNTVITAIIPAGKELRHWIVNGDIIEDEKLIINESLIIDGKVDVVLVIRDASRQEDFKAIITEISSDGDDDYIILYNPYKEDIDLLGYSITDDIEEPGKLILPTRILKAGKSLKILGKDNKETPTSGMIRAGFNLKEGETVGLYLKGEMVDKVTIPDLRKGSVYVRDLLTMKFTEVRK